MTTHLYIPGQLPDFIRSDYPLFVEFLQEYYRWLDKEYNNKKLSEIIDIDTTTQEYVDKIRRQLDVYGITSGKENQRFVLQKIKEIYSAKGTEAGIKVFLRLIFNKNSEVFYPNDIVLEPSASKWVRPCSVLGRFEVYPRDLENTIMTIETEQGHSIDVCALKFVQRKSSIFEIFIDKIIDKDLTPTWLIFSDGTKVRAQKTTKRVSVLNGGSGYRKGQVFRIDSYGGVGTVAKIKRVDRNGGVVSVEIIEYGYGYNGKFIAHLPSPKPQEGSSFSSSISGNSISATNLDLVSIASDIGIAVSNDYGSINGIDGYFSDPSYVGKVLSEIVGNAEPGSCSLMVEIGGVAHYPGRYENDGKLLGVAVLHDSDRFQRFSYEVRSEENFEHFKNVLLQLLHPAGHKLFGDYLLKTKLEVEPRTKFIYNRLVKKT